MARGVKVKKYQYQSNFNGMLNSFHEVIIPNQYNAYTYHFKAYSKTKSEKAKTVDFVTQSPRYYDTLWKMMLDILAVPWHEMT